MNWYTRTKIAVIVDDPNVNWTEIGHCNYYNPQKPEYCPGGPPEVEELWYISKTLKFTAVPSQPEFSHTDLVPDFNQYFAGGRFVKNKQNPDGLCSVQLGYEPEWNERRKEYAYNRVSKILEQHYGPKIHIILFRR